jgi:hypothetical protein
MLHDAELVTLRREGDFGTSKNWRLDARCRVDPPNQKAFNLVKSGREKTLWAVISNEAQHVQLVGLLKNMPSCLHSNAGLRETPQKLH